MRVLVVDDDEETRRLLVRNLQLASHGVKAVECCADARDLLASDRFDVVVLDVMLPDGSGIELCSQLRQAQVDVPILLELREQIFLPFFRGRPKSPTPGFGLGLPLARAVARAHGGEVEVGPERDQETQMVLRLPLVMWHQAEAPLG